MIAAVGQAVDREVAEREGLELTAWGLSVDGKTLAGLHLAATALGVLQ